MLVYKAFYSAKSFNIQSFNSILRGEIVNPFAATELPLLAICSLHLAGLGLVSAGSRGRWKNESVGKSKWNGSVSNVHVTKLEGLHQIYIFSPEAIFLSLPEQFARTANQL